MLADERLFGRSKRDQFTVEDENVVKKLPGIDKVVVRDDEQLAGISQPMNGRRESLGSILVQAAKWLVQQINLGLLGPRASEKGALLLSARERLKLPIGESGEIGHLKSFTDNGFVASAEWLPETEDGVASHLGQSAHGDGKIPVYSFSLGHISNQTRVSDRVAVKLDVSGFDGQQSRKGFEQGGLARSIGTKQSDARATCQLHVQVMDGGNSVVGNRQIFDDQLTAHGADLGIVRTS